MNKVWVIKIGSNLLTSGGTSIDKGLIHNLAKQIATLKQHNIDVILVSSGAIASGLGVIKFDKKPTDIHKLQALASIGQMDLMHCYENAFADFNIITSQILLTNENLINQNRYDNIVGTLSTLLEWNVVPIVNENDTVSFDEIKFGDNDNLAARLANLIHAEKLIILTDQNGVYNKNPSKYDDAVLIESIAKDDNNLDMFATSEGGEFGTGGMKSKILAARLTQCETHITNGKNQTTIVDILHNQTTGTILF
jgi:glutamate 5-kinase